MMVKPVRQSHHGQSNLKKKKVWIKISEEEDVEFEVEVYDIELLDSELISYDKKGKIIINEKKEKSIIDICV